MGYSGKDHGYFHLSLEEGGRFSSGIELAGLEVLVVEDEPMLQSLIQTILQNQKMQVTLAADADEALSILEQQPKPFRVAICDVELPGMNGWDLAQEMKRRLPKLRCILSSGYNTEQNLEAARTQGFGFIGKPYKPSQLLDEIRRQLTS